MAVVPHRLGRRRLVAILVAVVLLVASSGLSLASSAHGRHSGHGEPAAAKHGPPAWTHGFDVSRAAHSTPPGPGHGRAVSAIARSGKGAGKHGHPKHGRPDRPEHPSHDD